MSDSRDPADCSPPSSSVQEILQARILEWVPFPSSGDLPNPGLEPESPALADGFFTTEPPGKSINNFLSIAALLHWEKYRTCLSFPLV